MPSPNKNEPKKDYVSRCMSSKEAKRDFPDQKQRVAFCHSKWSNKGKGAVFVYRDTKTGEFHYFSRRGTHKKNGRTLVFVKKSKGDAMSDHILNKTEKTYNDEKAGYPPNCNDGYVEKDGKCVPVKENDAFIHDKDKEDKNGKDKKKNGKNGDKKKKKDNPFEKKDK